MNNPGPRFRRFTWDSIGSVSVDNVEFRRLAPSCSGSIAIVNSSIIVVVAVSFKQSRDESGGLVCSLIGSDVVVKSMPPSSFSFLGVYTRCPPSEVLLLVLWIPLASLMTFEVNIGIFEGNIEKFPKVTTSLFLMSPFLLRKV